MDRYVVSFTIDAGLQQKVYYCICHTVTELAGVIIRAEQTDYKLVNVTKLVNVYDTHEFLQLLDPYKQDNSGTGGDLLFGGGIK